MPLTDAEVVAKVLDGDVNAYAILVERYRNSCYRYAKRILGNGDSANDVAQQAFVRAYSALSQCSNPSRFASWLFQILVNCCRTQGVKNNKDRELFADVAIESVVALSITTGVDGESSYLADAIEVELNRLPAIQREAFLLKYMEEMTYDEMATVTGVNVSALKMRVSRACDTLRVNLSPLFAERSNA